MNSAERHEARYQRRKMKREQRKIDRARAVGGLTRVFTFTDMYRLGKKCCNGVRWKRSAQNFELHLFSGTAARRAKLFAKKWKPAKYTCFVRMERGKARPINAPRIQDRQIHKVLTRRVLLPLYLPDMIYNNGASIPGKGFLFSRKRLCEDLRRHYRKYGREGKIILIDFKKFFPNASHETIFSRHRRLLLHPNIRHVADLIVRSMPGERGMPLGVEASQMEMVALPSPLDNFIKCQLSLKGAGHYMDDYYVLVPPDRDPAAILEAIICKTRELGLTVNREKTQIHPLTKPFKYCKAKYLLTETGRVVVNGNRLNMYRSRRKFKSFLRMYRNGQLTIEDVYFGAQGAVAYFEGYNDHRRVLRLRRLFHALFGFTIEQAKYIVKEEKQSEIYCSSAFQRQDDLGKDRQPPERHKV